MSVRNRNDMPEDVEQRTQTVARLTRAGWSAEDIASELGVASRTVWRHRKRAGLSQGPAVPLTQEQEARAYDMLFVQRASLNETARTLGCSEKTLKKRWPEAGWTTKEAAEYANLVWQNPELTTWRLPD